LSKNETKENLKCTTRLFVCSSVNILFTYINIRRAKRRHPHIPVLDVTYYEYTTSSRPLHVHGTEVSLCTCALHCSKDTPSSPIF